MIPTLLESGVLAFFFILNFSSSGNRNFTTLKKFFEYVYYNKIIN
nr:MAG TPA: hypothetical protein [Caudoviricetes sp.]